MVWWGGGGPRKDAREILGGTFRVNAIGETPKERQQTSRLQWTATGVAVIAAIAALLGAILTGVANSKSATAASEAARTAKQAVTNQDLTTLITSLVAASQKTQELERTLQARHDLERLRGVPAADAPIEAALEALRDGAINLGLTVDSLITSVGDAEVRQCVEAIRAATSLIVLKSSDKGPGSPARPYQRVNSRAIANKGKDPGSISIRRSHNSIRPRGPLSPRWDR